MFINGDLISQEELELEQSIYTAGRIEAGENLVGLLDRDNPNNVQEVRSDKSIFVGGDVYFISKLTAPIIVIGGIVLTKPGQSTIFECEQLSIAGTGYTSREIPPN